MKTYTALVALSLALFSNAYAIVVRDDRAGDAPEAFAKWLPQPLVVATTKDGMANGMGSKIGDRFVLTAAHVATALAPGDAIGRDGAQVVKAVHFHPDGPSMERDIAVIETVDPWDDGDLVSICHANASIGDRIAIIGSGEFGDGLRGAADQDDVMRAAENTIDEAFPGVLSFRFDEPGAGNADYLEGVSGAGDSGGPAFALRNGRYCLAGVSSGQDTGDDGSLAGKYGAREYYVDAVAHRPWIDNIPGLSGE